MIDCSKLEVIAECKNGVFKNYVPRKTYKEHIKGIYMIRFSDDKFYIGVSNHLRNRLNQHYWGMITGKHDLKLLAETFEENPSFIAYLLSSTPNENMATERGFIYALQPTLNTILPFSNRVTLEEIRTVSRVTGISVSDLLSRNHKAIGSLKCPHCGADITIKIDLS